MFEYLDIVRLKRDVSYFETHYGAVITVPAGTYGTVLIVYSAAWGFQPTDPLQYEVDFVDVDGHTAGLLAVSEPDLELDFRRSIQNSTE